MRSYQDRQLQYIWILPLFLLTQLFTAEGPAMPTTPANQLANSSSPYLRQHAHNPVHWVEWSPAAFTEAQERGVPVIVSIGYSTCHWCHVMAHESFEDETVAKIMNEHFVCIKVDREVHPEVDEIYMDAAQAMTGRGGWPLNVVTDHSGIPFFAGTYFPQENWMRLLEKIDKAWKADPKMITDMTERMNAALQEMNKAPSSADASPLNDSVWDRLYAGVEQSYDSNNPGIAWGEIAAPKFPSNSLLPLLVHHQGVHSPQFHRWAEAMLEAMQDSGLHDRVGGGFHRYSVDAHWRVPHFEKMIYDNAQLLIAYSRAARFFARSDFLQTAENIAAYLERDLRQEVDHTFIGYATAEDADDPEGEGSFYAWSPAQLAEALGEENAATLAQEWNISQGIRERGHSGHWEPVESHIPHPRGGDVFTAIAEKPEQLAKRASWEHYLPLLEQVRAKRPRPGLDDKVLTDLNGLTLYGLSELAKSSANLEHINTIETLAKTLSTRHAENGLERLPQQAAFLTDYAYLMVGLCAAFEIVGDPSYITRAEALATEVLERNRAEDGGFYTTAAGREDLVRRSRNWFDNATPSGQNMLAEGFVRLWIITGHEQWKKHADELFAAIGPAAASNPSSSPVSLGAWERMQTGPLTIIITGATENDITKELHTASLQQIIQPYAVVIPADTARTEQWPHMLPYAEQTQPAAYICTAHECLAPVHTAKDLRNTLRALTP